MKKFTVSEDTEIVLNGKRMLLEAGDLFELKSPPTDINKIEDFYDVSDLDMMGIHPNTLIKFMDSNKKELNGIPGYCIKWGDALAVGMYDTWNKPVYRVHFNTAKLKPLPFDEDDITGYMTTANRNINILNAEQIEDIANRYKSGEDVDPGLLIDAVRSIMPGVYKSGDAGPGQMTEVIINAPCRMTRIDFQK